MPDAFHTQYSSQCNKMANQAAKHTRQCRTRQGVQGKARSTERDEESGTMREGSRRPSERRDEQLETTPLLVDAEVRALFGTILRVLLEREPLAMDLDTAERTRRKRWCTFPKSRCYYNTNGDAHCSPSYPSREFIRCQYIWSQPPPRRGQCCRELLVRH